MSWQEKNYKLGNGLIEIVPLEKQREKGMKKNKQSLREMWDTIQCTKTNAKQREGEKAEENVFKELMAEYILNLIEIINVFSKKY